MSMPATTGQPAWTITGQTEQTQVQAGGNPVRGVQVFYSTALGHTGSVFVPYSLYTVSYVRDQVTAAAAQMDAVGSLQGPPQAS